MAEIKQIKTFHTSCLRISKDWVDGEWVELARANLPGKVSPLQCERLFTSQVLKINEEELKHASSDLESDITAAHQSSDSDVPVIEAEATEVREGELSNYSNWSGKVSDSGCEHLDADRFEKLLQSEAEIKMTGVMSKLSRKRRHESAFFSLRGPMSNLVSNGLQVNEDRSLGWRTENEETDISEVELKRSRYGHEHVNSLSRSSGGGSLFNTVSTANLVMSR